MQTAAASGEGLAAGVIFTLPALVMLKVWIAVLYLETTLIAGFGGMLGVLFTIPLRRALIIDQPLQFPEGVATAEVLKVGAEGGGGVGVLVLAGVLGAVVKLGATGLKLWAEIVQFGDWISGGVDGHGVASGAKRGAPFYFGINASPALLVGRLHRRLQRRAGDLRGRGAQPLDRGPAVRDVRRSVDGVIIDPQHRVRRSPTRSIKAPTRRRRRRDPRRR